LWLFNEDVFVIICCSFQYFFLTAGTIAAGLVFLTVVGLTWAGNFFYFYFLFFRDAPDTGTVFAGYPAGRISG
jgi:hypothetical protein